MGERPYLDHTFHGKAFPLHAGGRVEYDKPETVSGAFHVDDFQDGAGVTLNNGEGKRWVASRQTLRETGWPVLISPLPPPSPMTKTATLILASSDVP